MSSRHWWNGRWGRLARRDIFVGTADGNWSVELRRGGVGGRSRTRTFDAETEAVEWVMAALLDSDGGWREVGPSSSLKVA